MNRQKNRSFLVGLVVLASLAWSPLPVVAQGDCGGGGCGQPLDPKGNKSGSGGGSSSTVFVSVAGNFTGDEPQDLVAAPPLMQCYFDLVGFPPTKTIGSSSSMFSVSKVLEPGDDLPGLVPPGYLLGADGAQYFGVLLDNDDLSQTDTLKPSGVTRGQASVSVDWTTPTDKDYGPPAINKTLQSATHSGINGATHFVEFNHDSPINSIVLSTPAVSDGVTVWNDKEKIVYYRADALDPCAPEGEITGFVHYLYRDGKWVVLEERYFTRYTSTDLSLGHVEGKVRHMIDARQATIMRVDGIDPATATCGEFEQYQTREITYRASGQVATVSEAGCISCGVQAGTTYYDYGTSSILPTVAEDRSRWVRWREEDRRERDGGQPGAGVVERTYYNTDDQVLHRTVEMYTATSSQPVDVSHWHTVRDANGRVLTEYSEGSVLAMTADAATGQFTLTLSPTEGQIKNHVRWDASDDPNGLTAVYHVDGGPSHDVGWTSIDPEINFDAASPFPVVDGDGLEFIAQWAGEILPEHSEDYTFYAAVDLDQIDITGANAELRLFINGENVGTPVEDAATGEAVWPAITLVGGVRHDIHLEFEDNNASVVSPQLVLRWSSASQPKEAVPSSRLFAGFSRKGLVKHITVQNGTGGAPRVTEAYDYLSAATTEGVRSRINRYSDGTLDGNGDVTGPVERIELEYPDGFTRSEFDTVELLDGSVFRSAGGGMEPITIVTRRVDGRGFRHSCGLGSVGGEGRGDRGGSRSHAGTAGCCGSRRPAA